MAAVTAPIERADAGVPRSAPSDAILVVENVVKRFDTPDGVLVAVDRTSLTVAPGEFLAVIGPSGCGKSTLFNIIGGLIEADEGTVKVSGERVSRPARCDRHDLPGGVDFSLAQRDRQRGVPARDRRPAESRALRSRPPFRATGWARRFRAALSGRAIGRHAPARIDGAHARGAAEDPADGRAVRRARRADAPAARRQGAADPAGPEADDAADHPQHHRGGAAVRPHPGHDLPARSRETDGRDRRCRGRASPRSSRARRSGATSPRSGATCARRRPRACATRRARSCARASRR